MSRRHTGLVVGKDFRPPAGAEPLDWCYLTVDISDDARISVRIRRDHVDKTTLGDVVIFKQPRQADHAVSHLRRIGTNPALLPPVRRTAAG